MPKIKTHKGTAKRFRLTKNGKLLRMKAGRNHLRRKKSSAQKRKYRHVISSDEKATIKMVKVATANNATGSNGKHTGNR